MDPIRRRLVRAVGVGAIGALAGCQSSDNAGDDEPPDRGNNSDEETPTSTPTDEQFSGHEEGDLDSGATYVIDVPDSWNGTVLLYSKGYEMGPDNPAENTADDDVADLLLEEGYALAGSSFASTGWAIEEAVPDQLAVLAEFEDLVDTPERTLAWGTSMGGLVTAKLVERHPDRIDGGLSLVGSITGSVPMLNRGLDAAFAFRTLLSSEEEITIVDVEDVDPMEQLETVQGILEEAGQTPEGRARIALAAALRQLPGWTNPETEQPAKNDYEARLNQQIESFPMAVFPPRADQEQRAGGVYSWNTGVDYEQQLENCGNREMVEALYDRADVSLSEDLETVNAQKRIEADPAAVDYMEEHYVTTGEIDRPMIAAHTIGDGITIPSHARTYAEKVREAGNGDLIETAYVDRAGHGTFTPPELVAAILTLDERVKNGTWGNTSAKALKDRANSVGDGTAAFVEHKPPRFLRANDYNRP